MPYHTSDCWCETCRRFRARIEALEAERNQALDLATERYTELVAALARIEALEAERDTAITALETALKRAEAALQAEVREWRERNAEAEALLLAALRERNVAQHALAEALVDTSPPTEEEIAYARQLEEAGR